MGQKNRKGIYMEDPLISVYTTVYNSVRTVEKSIESITRQFEGLNYEIVVVDNYSTDGTYEKLVELSERYPIRIIRYKCSRGLGRRIAAKLSRGKYLVYVDLDCIYTKTLRKLVEIHMKSVYKDSKCLYTLICPKKVLNEENFIDINRTEDVELFVRLAEKGLTYILPKVKWINLPLRYEMRKNISSSFLQGLIPTHSSERRYVRGVLNYMRRELRNKRDYIIGSGATPTKFVREEWFIWRIWRRHSLVTILIRTSLFLILYYTVKWFMKTKLMNHDKHLTHHIHSDFMSLKYIALPQELGLSCKDIEIPSIKDLAGHLQYTLRFKTIEEFKRLWQLLLKCSKAH
jgi:glycosyltransferase involved in cell wall biosynthesis